MLAIEDTIDAEMPKDDEYIHDKLDKKLLERIMGVPLPKRTLGYWVTLKIYIPKGFGVHREAKEANSPVSCSIPLVDTDGNIIPAVAHKQEERVVDLIIPEEYERMKKYRQCVGLVLATGETAYKGGKFIDDRAWVKVGQWVLFNLNSAVFRPLYKGIPMVVVPDDAVLWEVEDPDDIGTW